MKKILLPTLILTLSLPMLGYAASFYCTKASSATEKLICSDELLSTLDDQLAASYKVALEKVTDKEAFKKNQLGWLKKRNTCDRADCLMQFYEKRLMELQEINASKVDNLKMDSALIDIGSSQSNSLNSNNQSNVQGVEKFYGNWTGISRSTKAIFGHIHLSKFNISWGENNGYGPLCQSKYRIVYSGLASNYEWPKDIDEEYIKRANVLKIELLKESLLCEKNYRNSVLFDQIKFISLWVFNNDYSTASIFQFGNAANLLGEGTISRE